MCAGGALRAECHEGKKSGDSIIGGLTKSQGPL